MGLFGFPNLQYSITNECLDSIVKALNLRERDAVLAILGSGDQAFSLLESGARVVAVDTNYSQVDYAKWRARLLEDERFEKFVKTSFEGEKDYPSDIQKEKRNGYFDVFRLKRIRANLHRLSIKKMDIKHAVFEFYHNHLYLSNVLSHIVDKNFEIPRTLQELTRAVPQGGRVFVTDGGVLRNRWVSFGNRPKDAFIPDCLTLDHQASVVAQNYDLTDWAHWRPEVYRKN
jgi:hypothetical protein